MFLMMLTNFYFVENLYGKMATECGLTSESTKTWIETSKAEQIGSDFV